MNSDLIFVGIAIVAMALVAITMTTKWVRLLFAVGAFLLSVASFGAQVAQHAKTFMTEGDGKWPAILLIVGILVTVLYLRFKPSKDKDEDLAPWQEDLVRSSK